jgi:hypothetical protein
MSLRSPNASETIISIHQNLPARAANVFELRRTSLQNAIWQGKQKPITG